MSLFKVRDIWSLDLEELQRHSADTLDNASSPTSDIECRAQFIAHIGRFSCVGGQDVFVCGDLRGRIYLIQVPDSDQRKHIKSTRDRPATSASGGLNGSSDCNSRQTPDDWPSPFDNIERQILAAHDLRTPVVALKCGFFTSALKQSIAVLTYDKLAILQVKCHQVDLMSAPNIGEFTEGTVAGQSLDKNLLSHEFEVNIELDLLPGQFAYDLLVLNSHADSNLVDFDSSGSRNCEEINLDRPESTTALKESKNKFKQTSKQIVQQLHLPQRDKIIVQYTDQFVFTLIDSKKIVGHFCVVSSHLQEQSSSVEKSEQSMSGVKLKQMEHSVGCMPVAYLESGKSCNLAVTFSDFSVHSLPLDKLTNQAKQNVMKRVARNLLGGAKADLAANYKPSTLTSTSSEPLGALIQIDLEAIAEWSHELLGLPLAMQGLRRQRITPNRRLGKDSTTTTAQLLVMSRYSLDLFSFTGAHLWSQRFESPLICMHAYITRPSESIADEPVDETTSQELANALGQCEKTNTQYDDRIITLLCTDNLSNDKCNLIITADDRVSWSALLNSKPLQIWRLNLTHMPGMLATLDLLSGQLVVSYLGTNLESLDQVAVEMQGTSARDEDVKNKLVQLERLDEAFSCECVDQNSVAHSAKDDLRARLRVHNSLDATSSSDGTVQVCTSIQLDPNATGVVLHNITITFEFDDLLRFDSNGTQIVSHIAPGVAQICIGSCWPDRREPIKINATFSHLQSSSAFSNTKSFGASRGFDNLNDEEITQTLHSDEALRCINAKLLPKSLKVNQLLDFNETHSSLLHQQESFLLPISMIAHLTHIDYSSGQGQELEDVLGNLNQYWRDGGTTPALYCDLFLNIKHDFMTLLGEIIDGDLMCREQTTLRTTIEGYDDSSQKQIAMRRIETLENINLLAQSLNCRLRLMSPTPAGILRQTSEEPTQPVIVSLALRLKANNLNADQNTDEQIVWVHICDFTQANRSKIVNDFVDRHSKSWMKYQATFRGGTSEPVQAISQALISIECDQALPLVLVLDHLIERVRYLSRTDAKIDTRVISAMHSIDHTTGSNSLAISSKFHDSLTALVSVHNSEHIEKYKQLQSELVKEYCKLQVVTKTSLSMAKRLASLPDEMSSQVTCMVKLVKQYHQNLLSVLGEMERLKRIDYKYSKLPHSSLIEIESPNSPNGILWSGFTPKID